MTTFSLFNHEPDIRAVPARPSSPKVSRATKCMR